MNSGSELIVKKSAIWGLFIAFCGVVLFMVYILYSRNAQIEYLWQSRIIDATEQAENNVKENKVPGLPPTFKDWPEFRRGELLTSYERNATVRGRLTEGKDGKLE